MCFWAAAGPPSIPAAPGAERGGRAQDVPQPVFVGEPPRSSAGGVAGPSTPRLAPGGAASPGGGGGIGQTASTRAPLAPETPLAVGPYDGLTPETPLPVRPYDALTPETPLPVGPYDALTPETPLPEGPYDAFG